MEYEKMTDCKNCPYTDEYCSSGDCERDNDLTEKWRNGTLPQDYYYVQYNSNVKEGKPWVEIELRTYLFDLAKVRDAEYCKILAPVPSYEEWKALNKDYDSAVDANLE